MSDLAPFDAADYLDDYLDDEETIAEYITALRTQMGQEFAGFRG